MTAPVQHIAVHPVTPLAEGLPLVLREAIDSHATVSYVRDRDLSLRVRRLDSSRVIVLGERIVADFAPLQGRDASGVSLCQWHVSIARYYDIAWVRSGFEHAAETILEDFALTVFEREAYQHQTLR